MNRPSSKLMAQLVRQREEHDRLSQATKAEPIEISNKEPTKDYLQLSLWILGILLLAGLLLRWTMGGS